MFTPIMTCSAVVARLAADIAFSSLYNISTATLRIRNCKLRYTECVTKLIKPIASSQVVVLSEPQGAKLLRRLDLDFHVALIESWSVYVSGQLDL